MSQTARQAPNRRRSDARKRRPGMAVVGYWPSHTRLPDLINFSVHGGSESAFHTSRATDHVAELCMLMHGDIDPCLWRKRSPRDGVTVRKIIDALLHQVRESRDAASAERLLSIATYASFAVMEVYVRHRPLFDRIAPRRTILPCLTSIHPATGAVMATMREDSRLGTQTPESRYIGSRAWFTSDAPANVYARAIITGIELNRNLDPIEKQQATWKPFDRKNDSRTYVLPFPRYVSGIEVIPVPISPDSVPQYWRKGKEMILEEIPDFIDRPEWRHYHRRSYKNGATPGAIQHAIFKDILIALRTIAGANRGLMGSSTLRRNRNR
jgi:hypothetical protein